MTPGGVCTKAPCQVLCKVQVLTTTQSWTVGLQFLQRGSKLGVLYRTGAGPLRYMPFTMAAPASRGELGSTGFQDAAWRRPWHLFVIKEVANGPENSHGASSQPSAQIYVGVVTYPHDPLHQLLGFYSCRSKLFMLPGISR